MPLFAEAYAGQVLFLLGLAVLMTMLLLRSRRRLRQTGREAAEPAPAVSLGRGASPPHRTAAPLPISAPRQLEQWQVEMHDLARDLTAALQTRTSALAELVRQADQVAARLEAALDRMDAAARERPDCQGQDEAPPQPRNPGQPLGEPTAVNEPNQPPASISGDWPPAGCDMGG
jgi:hypothetical protein